VEYKTWWRFYRCQIIFEWKSLGDGNLMWNFQCGIIKESTRVITIHIPSNVW